MKNTGTFILTISSLILCFELGFQIIKNSELTKQLKVVQKQKLEVIYIGCINNQCSVWNLSSREVKK